MKEETRKEMQRKMADFKKTAPSVSWGDIEKALARKNPSSKVTPIWLIRSVAAAMLLLLAGIGFMLFMPISESTNQQLAETETKKNISDTGTEEKSNAIVEVILSLAKKKFDLQEEPLIASNTIVAGDEDMPVEVAEDYVTAIDNSEDIQQKAKSDTERAAVTNKSDVYRDIPQQGYNKRTSVTDNRLTAKAYMSNMGNGTNNATSTNPLMYSAKPFGMYSDEMNSFDLMPLSENQPEIEEEVNHHQPIRFGVSLRYSISNRWSIESGLSYTLLSADITRRINGYTYAVEQKLSYVGIPFNVNYSIWQNRHFNIYTSAGGLIEKMVSGKQTTTMMNQSSDEPIESKDVHIRPLQYSVNGGIGAEYNINKNISVYAEPGVAYHFNNGSTISTFYQDKPLSFNINLGMRFNLK